MTDLDDLTYEEAESYADLIESIEAEPDNG